MVYILRYGGCAASVSEPVQSNGRPPFARPSDSSILFHRQGGRRRRAAAAAARTTDWRRILHSDAAKWPANIPELLANFVSLRFNPRRSAYADGMSFRAVLLAGKVYRTGATIHALQRTPNNSPHV
jgi:hypothetical protein